MPCLSWHPELRSPARLGEGRAQTEQGQFLPRPQVQEPGPPLASHQGPRALPSVLTQSWAGLHVARGEDTTSLGGQEAQGLRPTQKCKGWVGPAGTEPTVWGCGERAAWRVSRGLTDTDWLVSTWETEIVMTVWAIALHRLLFPTLLWQHRAAGGGCWHLLQTADTGQHLTWTQGSGHGPGSQPSGLGPPHGKEKRRFIDLRQLHCARQASWNRRCEWKESMWLPWGQRTGLLATSSHNRCPGSCRACTPGRAASSGLAWMCRGPVSHWVTELRGVGWLLGVTPLPSAHAPVRGNTCRERGQHAGRSGAQQ